MLTAERQKWVPLPVELKSSRPNSRGFGRAGSPRGRYKPPRYSDEGSDHNYVESFTNLLHMVYRVRWKNFIVFDNIQLPFFPENKTGLILIFTPKYGTRAYFRGMYYFDISKNEVTK